jgi:hypothetical protein
MVGLMSKSDPEEKTGNQTSVSPDVVEPAKTTERNRTKERYRDKATRILSYLWNHRPDANQNLALGAWALAIVGICAIRTASHDAQEAADVARTTLVVSQRPWISVSTALPVSPFTWEEKGGRTAIQLTVKNVGKSPAFGVRTEIGRFIKNRESFDEIAELKKFCGKVRDGAAQQPGDVMFPDEEVPQTHGLLFDRSAIEQNAKDMKIPFFSPIVLVCVDYASTITGKRHSTGLVYWLLLKPTDATLLPRMIPTDKGDIQTPTMYLARSPLGSYAD